jgi:hypothetical protein
LYLYSPTNCQVSIGLTKHRAHFSVTEEEEQSSKNILSCIENSEQAERRYPQLGKSSVSLAMAGDSLRGKVVYLKNRGNLHVQIVQCAEYFVQKLMLSTFTLGAISRRMQFSTSN